MSIFTTRKPKHFQRQYRFANERKEYIESRRRAIMFENGQLPMEDMKAEELLHGKFVNGTTHLRRRLEKDGDNPDAKKKRYVKMAVWLVVLVVLLYWLVKTVYFS